MGGLLSSPSSLSSSEEGGEEEGEEEEEEDGEEEEEETDVVEAGEKALGDGGVGQCDKSPCALSRASRSSLSATES